MMQQRRRQDYPGEFIITRTTFRDGRKIQEREWIDNPIVNQHISGRAAVVAIDRSEVVRPAIPDYYAQRRAEYPPLAEQLDAVWKGGQAHDIMRARILAVKDKYPKP